MSEQKLPVVPKFRAWDKETKTMNGMGEIYRNRNQEIELHPRDENIILMQSTGLLDAFGTEIFEGDIVTKNQGETFGVVRYGICRSSLCFYVEQNYKGSELTFPINTNFSRYYKVVGNIYKNPELLGE